MKDDDKDAKWIADLFKLGMVKSSFITDKNIRVLRELCRYQYKITCIHVSEKNRFQNALTVGNCKVDLVFTDVFDKSSSAIIDKVLSGDSYTNEEILSLVHKRCKVSHENILNAVNGVELTDIPKNRIKIIHNHIDYLKKMKVDIQNNINTIVAPYEPYINLLCTIPGMHRNSAITIISKICIDMDHFSSSYHITAWAGLTPASNRTGGKNKSVKISKAGVYLKPCLVEVAHIAVKDNNTPYYANKFKHISKRRNKKRAIIAIARKILVAIYHMIKIGEVFNPRDLADVETTPEKRQKFIKKQFKPNS